MTPFANEVWFWIFIAYFSVSFCFFCLARICPSEWVSIPLHIITLAFYLTMKIFNFTFRRIYIRAIPSQGFWKRGLLSKTHFGLRVWIFIRFFFQNRFPHESNFFLSFLFHFGNNKREHYFNKELK